MLITFLISLLVCIFVHEFAHLVVAKFCKCSVDIFSIGFGKPFYKKEYKGTIYQITPFLLGGYCKLKDELVSSNSPEAFTNLTYKKKLLIILAGVTANILVGLFFILLDKYFNNIHLFYFGYLSLVLGLTNLIPFPALDGSYPILVWLEKFYGKERGYELMGIICKTGFTILMILQVLLIPYIIITIKNGGF